MGATSVAKIWNVGSWERLQSRKLSESPRFKATGLNYAKLRSENGSYDLHLAIKESIFSLWIHKRYESASTKLLGKEASCFE